MLENVQIPTVDDSFFPKLESELGRIKTTASASSGPPRAAKLDPVAWVLDQLSPDVRDRIQAGIEVVNQIAAEGYLEISGSTIRVGRTPVPVPQGGIIVQFPSKRNTTLCVLGTLLILLGVAIIVIMLAVVVILCVYAVITAGLSLTIAGLAAAVAFAGYVLIDGGRRVQKTFCQTKPWPVAMTWNPGKQPVIANVQSGWAE